MQILSGYSVCKMTPEYSAQFPDVDRISAMQIRGRKFFLRLLYIYIYVDACLCITYMPPCKESIFHINTVFFILSTPLKIISVITLAHVHCYNLCE